MADFKDVNGKLVRVVTPDESDRGRFHLFSDGGAFLDNDLAPAIAATVLEAGGVELSEDDERLLDEYDVVRYSGPAIAESDLRAALFYLKRAAAIREYHAKPRVSEDQVQEIADAAYSQLGAAIATREDVTRAVLQAAVDSGVLQVPADPTNKEGDRG